MPSKINLPANHPLAGLALNAALRTAADEAAEDQKIIEQTAMVQVTMTRAEAREWLDIKNIKAAADQYESKLIAILELAQSESNYMISAEERIRLIKDVLRG